jgi:hypothetical protein
MGNACATSDESKQISVSFKERVVPEVSYSHADLPNESNIETADAMWLPSVKANKLYKATGNYLLRSDPATKDYVTGRYFYRQAIPSTTY